VVDSTKSEAETVPEAPVQRGSGNEGNEKETEGTVKWVSSSSSSLDEELEDDDPTETHSDSGTGVGFQLLVGVSKERLE